MKNSKDFIYFVLKRSPNGRIRSHYGFNSYADLEGNIIEYHEGMISKSTGQPEPTNFNFSRRHKVMNVHKGAKAKDRNGNEIYRVDFLRGHPECEGSPNNTGQTTWFKEMDADKDVEVALEASEIRRSAESLAANLEGEALKSAAALYNEVSDSTKKQKFAVLQWAFHDPEDFTKKISSDDFKIRGFIVRCLANRIFEKQGTMIKWGSVTIGIDEDDAIRKLLLDETTASAVAKLLKDKEAPYAEEKSEIEQKVEEVISEEKKKSLFN